MKSGKFFWLPPVLWGAIIIILSLLPGGTGHLQLLGIPHADKVGHFGMYAIWGFLIYRAFIKPNRLSRSKAFWATILLCTLIGIVLEFGQDTVTIGRSYELADMLANGLGAISGTVVAFLLFKKAS